MHARVLLAILCAACSAARAPRPAAAMPADAQAPVAGAEFLPADYQGELFLDWQAMRDVGLLDRVLRLPMAEEMLAVVVGPLCSLDDLVSTRTAFVQDGSRDGNVTVVQLAAGAVHKTPPKEWHETQVGPFAALRHGASSRESVSFYPQPDLAVDGTLVLLEELTAGRQTSGGPHPELRPLLGGDSVLAQFAYGRFGRAYDDVLRTFGHWFGAAEDPVDFVRLRLHQAADGALVFAITFRFQNGTSGLLATEQLVRGKLDAMLDDPRLGAFKPIFGAVVVAHLDRDLTASLVLGTPREAVSKLEQAMLALYALQQEDAARGR